MANVENPIPDLNLPLGDNDPPADPLVTEEPAAVETPETPEYEISDYGKMFFQGVPEETQAQLEPYLKQWDAGANRRFQEYQGTINQYEELGSLEEIADAIKTVTFLKDPNNHRGLYNELAKVYGQPQQPAPTPTQDLSPDFEELAPVLQQLEHANQQREQQYQQQMGQVINTLTALSQRFDSFQTTATDDAAKNALDNQLNLLSIEKPHVDLDWIRQEHGNGVPINDAVAKYESAIASARQQQAANTAPVVPGGGSPSPHNPLRVEDLSNQDTQSLVVSILKEAAAQQ